MDESTLKRIFDPITKEKCILILGPNISLTDTKTTVNQLLKKEIENSFAETPIKKYFSDDEFFLFKDDDDENTALGFIGECLKKMEPSELQKKITEIPFHVIISTSPDRLLVDLFNKNNYNYTYASSSTIGNILF